MTTEETTTEETNRDYAAETMRAALDGADAGQEAEVMDALIYSMGSIVARECGQFRDGAGICCECFKLLADRLAQAFIELAEGVAKSEPSTTPNSEPNTEMP